MTPVDAYLKFNELEVYFNLKDRRDRKRQEQKNGVYLKLLQSEQYSLEEIIKTGILRFIK